MIVKGEIQVKPRVIWLSFKMIYLFIIIIKEVIQPYRNTNQTWNSHQYLYQILEKIIEC